MGFLKGRWSSLKGLRVSIKGQRGVQYATLWIIACINLHAFAMRHEAGDDMRKDKFYRDGKKYQQKQERLERMWKRDRRRRTEEEEAELDEDDDVELLRGKIKREELKEELLRYLDEDN